MKETYQMGQFKTYENVIRFLLFFVCGLFFVYLFCFALFL